jgi:hypothetical protein
MRSKRVAFIFLGAGFILLVVVGMLFLLPPTQASAQCGSQASSCKNCHETQGQDPVNADGTPWHTQHAFGDFCYLCHGGNNQATDETAAHTGLEAPLADINTSCKTCHPDDTGAKAQTYASILGESVGTGAAATPGSDQPAATAVPAATEAPAQAAVVPSADLVDYSQRYDETVLGKKPVNIGNVILIVMIAGLLFGGGYFVLRRENLLKISFQDTKSIQDGVPADVVDMIPEIEKLKPSARKNLRQILSKTSTATELFALLAKLIEKEEPPAHEDQE